MKHVYAVLVLFVTLIMVSCNKPNANLVQDDTFSSTAAIFSTSLADSLPQRTFEALGVGQVTGVKVIGLDGLDVRYFEYKADAETLLTALSHSPFDIQSKIADTTCRMVRHEDLERELFPIHEAEVAYSSKMLTNNGERFEYYVCAKSPVKHFVVIDRSAGKVWHRIARQS
jgi:hypothetical protein